MSASLFRHRCAYVPISMFKALLLIYLGQAESERELAVKLQFDVRLQSLCGFDFFDTPAHSSFHYFREPLGSETFHEILHQIIAQAIAIGVINKLVNTAIDSTHLWAYSSKFGIKVCQCKENVNVLKSILTMMLIGVTKRRIMLSSVTKSISLLILNLNYQLKSLLPVVKFLITLKLMT